jgi:nucleotide-binding universal stress UspA family protein
VCIDHSERTEALLQRARWLGAALSAEIWLLHVAAPEPDFIGFEPGPPSVRQQVAMGLRREHQETQQHADRLREAGLTVTPLVVQGRTVERIVEHAERLGVDLIVIGSRGHGVVYEAVIGSVAHDLLVRSTRPVVVVPPAPR